MSHMHIVGIIYKKKKKKKWIMSWLTQKPYSGWREDR